MIVTQNTKLNAVPGGIIPVVHVSQFDVNRAISFTIYDGNAPAVLSEGTTVSIEGTKPDGHGFQYAGTLSDNVALFNTTQQMTVIAGAFECKLTLRKDTQVIGTAMFIMDVEKAGLDGNTDISDTEIPAIIELASQQESNAEAWANGTRGGVPTDPTDPTYHKDSRYWAEYAESAVTGVTGVKGNAEETYRRGNVNITHADLGMDTVPTQNSINPVTSNGIYEALQPITSSIASIGGQIGNTDISSIGATITGAISSLGGCLVYKTLSKKNIPSIGGNGSTEVDYSSEIPTGYSPIAVLRFIYDYNAYCLYGVNITPTHLGVYLVNHNSSTLTPPSDRKIAMTALFIKSEFLHELT